MTAPNCVIYGLSLDGQRYRYVGFTRTGVGRRMSSHRSEARKSRATRGLYAWWRDAGLESVVCTVLEVLPDDATSAAAGQREQHWISKLRAAGFDLFNLADGGLGRPGVRWSEEERAAISERVKKQDISHLWTPENKAKASAAQVGIKHKKHEFKDPGRQVTLGAVGAHTRWHVSRGIVNPDCGHCRELTPN